MNARAQLSLLALVALSALGCMPSAYTNIEKVEDGYVLTKNQSGPFSVQGETWHCKPYGKKLVCKQIGYY
jgi:hypothetical protein